MSDGNATSVLTAEPPDRRVDEVALQTKPLVSLRGPKQNSLLASLPESEYSRITENLALVALSCGEQLFQTGDKLQTVYFPTTAIISLLYVMADGATTEVAMVGQEGIVGMCLFLGEHATSDAVVQSTGYCYSMKTKFLRDAFNSGGLLPELLMRYANTLFTQLTLSTVGSQHSSVEQKLCRWLLDRHDRSRSKELKVTQELIAAMLGVRRESITSAARKLQRDGFIQYRRGHITVEDRDGLEQQAGEFYKVATAKSFAT